jgi:ribosomal protein S27E
MSKLVCNKCQGTLFVPTGLGIVYSVYVPNGTPPSEMEYKCSNCGNTQNVYVPAKYDIVKPQEVELPEQPWVNDMPAVFNSSSDVVNETNTTDILFSIDKPR